MGGEMVKDFHSGKIVTRFRYKVPSRPCAGCGTHTVNYDSKYGWYVCADCDSDEIASDLTDHVLNPNRGL